jgi:putative DNA primase/helicase
MITPASNDWKEVLQQTDGAVNTQGAYDENDGGNAEMFADRYSKVVRYIHDCETWFVWNDNRWLPDSTEKVHRLALDLSKTTVADLLKLPGRPDREKLRRAIAMGSQSKISSMLWLARSDPRIVIKREEIDADNFLLGARNGVIDLRTGERRDGRKGDFITKSCGCNHDEDAVAPRWRAFLKEIFAEQDDLINYIQRLVGYSLTGDTREQCLVFLYGAGANGKSTFIETLMELLGDYGTTASQNILCFDRHAREPLDEIASLEGARFVSIAETGGNRMAEVRIKQLTGGDTVTGKPHYKAAMSFRPKFKLWIFGNSRPTIYGVDHAIWRRIQLIPFNVQFPTEKRDSALKEKLFRELPGILNWAIEGALAWQAEGRLVPPECVVAATNQYREDEDVLRDFIAEKIEPTKGHELEHKELYRVYKCWHAEGSSERPFSSKKLAQMFRDRGYKAFEAHARALSWYGSA